MTLATQCTHKSILKEGELVALIEKLAKENDEKINLIVQDLIKDGACAHLLVTLVFNYLVVFGASYVKYVAESIGQDAIVALNNIQNGIMNRLGMTFIPLSEIPEKNKRH